MFILQHNEKKDQPRDMVNELCTLFLLGLQLYWNYQAYRSNSRVFKSDINDALDKTVATQMNMKRDGFARLYKKWLADTSLITITVRYSERMKSNVYSIKDTHPPFKDRPPFSIGTNEIKYPIQQITPAIKVGFINHFVKNPITNELLSGSAYFYTQRLGDSLVAAFNRDRLDMKLLKQLYRKELAERDIDSDFELHTTKYIFKGFNADTAITTNGRNATRAFKYGFNAPMLAISAYFPRPNLVFLQRMKWVLLASLVLIGITIACFIYTVRTMLSQKKLTELKDNFVNNMTHELKTPVATISIAAEAIQDFGLSKVSADEYLSIIRCQAGNLTNLIDQILKSIVSEQASIVLNPQVISLVDIFNNCVTQYQPQLKAANASLNVDITNQFVSVNGDTAHLGNVIANLLDNAIRYGEENPVIYIQIKKDQEYAVFKITNSGENIPAEYRDKVFDRFFRVPTGNKHNVKGYGLGLSYVKEIIRQHGGKITMTSVFSQTTFTIQLPLAKNENATNITA